MFKFRRNKVTLGVKFDKKFYLSRYSDVAAVPNIDAKQHYLEHGRYEGRFASREMEKDCFDAAAYLKRHGDVARSGMDPYEHYSQYGRAEGRPFTFKPVTSEQIQMLRCKYAGKAYPGGFDSGLYIDYYQDAADYCIRYRISPYEHYEHIGHRKGYLLNLVKLTNLQKAKKIFDATFSVIIPVYNSASYLYECLLSAYNQTTPNVEVVIVNDGSRDSSGDIIEVFRSMYPERTKVITHEVNKGLVQTHKDGISAATGEYITILDGDDWLSPYFCEMMGEVAKAYDLSCVVASWYRPDRYVAPTKEKEKIKGLVILQEQSKRDICANWGGKLHYHHGLNRKLYRRSDWNLSLFEGIDEALIQYEDAVVGERFLDSVEKIGVISNKLYYWYDNPNSVSYRKASKKLIDDSFKALSYLDKETDTARYERQVRKVLCMDMPHHLKSLKDTPEELREMTEYFAELFDEYRNIIPEAEAKNSIATIMWLYADSFKDIEPEDYVLFVDSIGQPQIKLHYLDYFREHSKLNFEHIQCSDSDALKKRLERVRLGAFAKCLVCTGGWSISEFYSSRPKIQLWHGMGAVKKVQPFPPQLRPQLGFCSSLDVVPVYSNLFVLPRGHVYPFGSIVADDYMDARKVEEGKARVFKTYPGLEGKKLYLWAPTFRGVGANCYIQDKLNFTEIEKMLEDDEVLLVKYHPIINYYQKDDTDYSAYTKIVNVTDYDSIYDLVAAMSAFMTDYSSAMHYALLQDKPIAYLITDWKEYTSSVGITLKYDSLPGEVCTTIDSTTILAALRNASSDTDKYRTFKRYHVGSCTGNCRERITRAIEAFFDTL